MKTFHSFFTTSPAEEILSWKPSRSICRLYVYLEMCIFL